MRYIKKETFLLSRKLNQKYYIIRFALLIDMDTFKINELN